MSDSPMTYAAAGVDVEAGDKAVELMKASVRRAQRPEVMGGLGGFAGLGRSPWSRIRSRRSSTVGSGTGTADMSALV